MTEIIDTQGIILSLRPYGETSAIIDVFTQTNGLIKGYVKGAKSKKTAGIYQKGNIINLIHTRRLTEQLGVITADMEKCLWHELSKNRLYFKIFNIICDLKLIILANYVYEPIIYQSFMNIIRLLLQSPDDIICRRAYVDYLYIVLQQTGYAPDFGRCAVSGTEQEVIYVSPKTANSICRSVGQTYHNRLLILPEFLHNHTVSANENDIYNGQKIMQLCYDKFIFHPRNLELSLLINQ